MLERAFRAAIMDPRFYRNMTDDPALMLYALLTVIVTGVALGLGIRNIAIVNFEDAPGFFVVLMAVSTRLTGWFIWAGVAYVMGTLVLRGEAGFRQLLRSLGFAMVPGILALFAEVPVVGQYFFAISVLWLFPAGLVAIKETQKFHYVKAFFSNALGWWLAFVGLPAILIPIGQT